METKQVTNPVVSLGPASLATAMLPSPSARNKKVAIAGAGLGGLATAIALRNQGIDAHVYEKARELRPVGGGLCLTPNGLKSLEAISPGIVEKLKLASCQLREYILKKHTGETIQSIPSGYFEKYGQPALLFWWWRLQQVLASALPPEAIHLDSACTGFKRDEGGVTVYFNGGETVRADLLIGADGLNSTVRQALVGDGPPRYVGSTCLRAVFKYSDELLQPNELIALTAEKQRLYILGVGGGYRCWTAHLLLPEPSSPEGADLVTGLFKGLADWWEPARAIVAATPPEKISLAPVCDRPPLKSWSQGRVTLVGDAAHPMAPGGGQGANSTFEDAWELAQCLSTSPTIEVALTTYENRRIPRTKELQSHSAIQEIGLYSAGETETGDREIGERELIAKERFRDWIYRYDPKSDSRWELPPEIPLT